MSWNGVTEVRLWNIYTGSPDNMQLQTSVARDGFATTASFVGTATHIQVIAVEYDGIGLNLRWLKFNTINLASF